MRSRRTASSLFAIALACVAGAAPGASFDCAKASSAVERTICAQGELSRLDDRLGRFYSGARAKLGEAASCLERDQRGWLSGRRGKCRDAGCLERAYRERLAELLPLQPGMNVPRDLELPAVAALAWVIGPAADEPKLDSKPFRAAGTLEYGHPEGGYFIRDAAGRSYLLVPDVFLEGATAVTLPVLRETHPRARFAARGFLASDERGQAFFDRRRCIFLHRLP